MSTSLWEIRQSIKEARQTLQNAEAAAYELAQTLQGRLRSINDRDLLRSLKRELADYNANTGKWRERA